MVGVGECWVMCFGVDTAAPADDKRRLKDSSSLFTIAMHGLGRESLSHVIDSQDCDPRLSPTCGPRGPFSADSPEWYN